VMDVIYGCGGAEGWRSIFSSSLELDDLSDTASLHSEHRSVSAGSYRSKRSSMKAEHQDERGGTVASNVGTVLSAKSKKSKDGRTVSMLRPKKPIISLTTETISDVSKLLVSYRGDAAIIVNEAGALAGIITDTDITRRVVAKHVDPRVGVIADVMTPDPMCVSNSDIAMDAMSTMVENHFRHLPVLDDEGAVVGLLDIAKCLNDAISKLEKVQSNGNDSAEKLLNQALQGSGNGAALHALLGPLLSHSFGGKSTPTLRSILSGRPSTIVTPQASVLSAGLLMAETRKAALVVEDGHLIGIFGFKDMMSRVIANDLDVETTCVADVMTADPEFVSPELNVLEALQVMHDDKFLTLPVCEEDGKVVGLVDVMDVINSCGGAEGWRSVFDSALDVSDDTVTENQSTAGLTERPKNSYSASVSAKKSPIIKVSRDAPFVMSPLPGNIPTTLEFAEDDQQDFDGDITLLSDTRYTTSQSSYGPTVQFKIVDPSGHTHRVRSESKLSRLLDAFAEKVKINKNSIQFKFVDDEGDTILITSDDDLIEAIKLSRTSGSSTSKSLVKLTAVEIQRQLDSTMLAGAVAAMAVAGIFAISLFRK
jgi:CBS domain-containing protein